jgi:hypothetical protein
MDEIEAKINQFKRYMILKIKDAAELKNKTNEMTLRDTLTEFLEIFDN